MYHRQFSILLVLFLLRAPSIHGQDIKPLDLPRTEDGVSYIDISGLGEGNAFYQADSLDIQLLDTDPVFTVKNTFQSERYFYGESDDSMISFSLVRHDKDEEKVLAGVLYDRQRNLVYEIRRDEDRQQYVRVFPEEDIPEPGDPPNNPDSRWQELLNFHSTTPIIPSMYNKVANTFGMGRQEDVTTITVLIVWTQSTECYHSNLPTGCTLTNTTLATMEAAVDLMIEETNTAFTNSGIGAQLQLVHAERDWTGYRESDMRTTLSQISQLDFALDQIQWLRVTKGADLVQMIVDNRVDAAQLGGIAWLPRRNLVGLYDAGAGYSVICAQCMSGKIFLFLLSPISTPSLLLCGTTQGCLHDRGTGGDCLSCASNFGYRSPTGSFRTIMSYRCRTGQCDNNPGGSCPVIPYFSGDESYSNGEKMGGPENSCRSEINRMKCNVALYRFCQVLPIPPLGI